MRVLLGVIWFVENMFDCFDQLDDIESGAAKLFEKGSNRLNVVKFFTTGILISNNMLHTTLSHT